jgi:hypothetical protein
VSFPVRAPHTLTLRPADAISNTGSDEWIAVLSGLNIGSPSPSDAQIQMLVEYLAGEQGGPKQQVSASQISRLIVAGDSLAPVVVPESNVDSEEKKSVGVLFVAFVRIEISSGSAGMGTTPRRFPRIQLLVSRRIF